MTIGIYDIDFFHGSKFAPNLELMKTFNYFLKQGHQVLFLRPHDDMGRCNKIFFFKSRPNTKIPLNLQISGENRTHYGFGFYKKFIALQPAIEKCEPTFLPYEVEIDKLKQKDRKLLNRIKNNSIIRLENKDTTAMQSVASTIFIADEKLETDNIRWFLDNYKEKIDFLYDVSLSEEQFVLLNDRLRYLTNVPMLDANVSCSFFKAYYKSNIKWLVKPKPYERNWYEYAERLTKMALWCKQNGSNVWLIVPDYVTSGLRGGQSELLYNITQWGLKKLDCSLYDFLKNIKSTVDLCNVIDSKTDLRLLSKTKPKQEFITLDF